MFETKTLSPNAIACLGQLFVSGPTWDGNICTKAGRGELFELGLANRINGFAFLTKEGVELAISWDNAQLITWYDQRWYEKKNCK